MESNLTGKRVKVYAQGAFATGTFVNEDIIDGVIHIEVRTDSSMTAYIINPGIIFVEDDVKFPKLED